MIELICVLHAFYPDDGCTGVGSKLRFVFYTFFLSFTASKGGKTVPAGSKVTSISGEYTSF